MKSSVLKENLKEGLVVVERIATKSLSLPVLNNILMTVAKNTLEVSATDLEIAVTYEILSKNDTQGNAVIPSRSLSQFVGLLSDQLVELESKEGILFVKGKNQEASLKTIPADDFPVIPPIQNPIYTISIPAQLLCEGIAQVVHLASLNQTRPEISGVFFSFSPKELRVVATDSFRLGEKIIPLQKGGGQAHFILPQKAAREILTILGEKKSPIQISISSNQALFEYHAPQEPSEPHIKIISRLIEGEYPNYQDVIPQSHQTKITAKKTELLNQLKAASIFSNKIQEIHITADPKSKTIELNAKNTEFGENKSTLHALVEGKEGEASFNWRFLIDGISQIKASDIEFGMNGSDGPASLQGVGEEGYRYVIMPLKV